MLKARLLLIPLMILAISVINCNEVNAKSTTTPEIKEALEGLERLKVAVVDWATDAEYNAYLRDAQTKINILERTKPPEKLLQAIKLSYKMFYHLIKSFKAKREIKECTGMISERICLNMHGYSDVPNMKEFDKGCGALFYIATTHLEKAYSYL
jgi:hypothetical protein